MPVDEATAMPAIQKFLANQRVAEVTENELKVLKVAANIEYIGALTSPPKPDTAPRQGSNAAAAPLPLLPQLDQMPIDTGANRTTK
jgi:hypothetical protein